VAACYGILLRGGEVDVTATDELRRRRASGTGRCSTRLAPIGTPDLSRARRLDDHLAVRESPDGGTVGCVHCGTEIGPLAGSA
jgi:N-methylhydantoinase B